MRAKRRFDASATRGHRAAACTDRRGGATSRCGATEVAIDGWVLAFAIAVSMLAGILAGLAPAISVSRSSPKAAMSPGTRIVGDGRRPPGAFLVGCEVALAVLLLTGAGLLVRSFNSLVGRELGFESGGVVIADVTLCGTVARGFKLPSFFALASPPQLGGNPDLRPETSVGVDFGVDQPADDLDLAALSRGGRRQAR